MRCLFEGGFKWDFVIFHIKLTKLTGCSAFSGVALINFLSQIGLLFEVFLTQVTIMIYPGFASNHLIVHGKKTQAMLLGNYPL